MHNTWIGDEIENIFKFPNSNTIKISFKQTSVAKKATDIGFNAFNLSIPAHDIRLETFTPIKTCMRCYALEKHSTRDCPLNRDHKICSECGELGNIWNQCKTNIKKCINCEGPHRTLAMKCPMKKKMITEKRRKN